MLTKYRLEEDLPFSPSGFMYDLFAEDQELFPTIETESRSTVCTLAIGRVPVLPSGEGKKQSMAFGLGQIFIRKYSLAWNNEILSDSEATIETKFYTLKGDPVMTVLQKISGFLIFFSFVLVGFFFLTMLKLNRVRVERKTY